MSSPSTNEPQKNSPRTQKESNPNKIQTLNYPNIDNFRNSDNNAPKKIKFYKKVLVKPFTSRKKDKYTKSNDIKKINKNHVNSKPNKLSLNNKINITKNDELLKGENKITIVNNYLKNVINKIPRRKCKNNFVSINDKNNFTKGNEKFINFNLSKSINHENNASNNNNKSGNSGDKINNKRKKGKEIKEITNNENNIFINNDLSLNFFKEREKILNINYINSIPKDVYKKTNSSIFLKKIYPSSNSIMNENFNILNNTLEPSNIKNKPKINKFIKKAILLDDNDFNIANNKSKNILNPTYNYFSSLTEINPNLKYEEIEKTPFKNNEIGAKEKFKTLENTKRIISLIEKEKQNLLNDNYAKYIKLIQKQQEQYKEYELYLKKELKRNKKSQQKLELIKENCFNSMKNSFIYENFENFPLGTKTYSTNNINKHKNKNKHLKNKIFPLNKLNNKLKLGIDNSNQISSSRNTARNIIKREIKIKEDILKRKNKNKIFKKTSQIMNKINITNPNTFRNNKSNIYHLNITLKPIINTDRSLNYEIQNFSFDNKVFKNPNHKILYNFSDNFYTNTIKPEKSKNKIMFKLNNNRKNFILKKLMNKVKNGIVKKSKSKKISINKDLNFKEYFKSNSSQKFKVFNRYNYESNILKDTNDNKKRISKIINSNIKSIYNNLNEENPTYIKFRNSLYYPSLKEN